MIAKFVSTSLVGLIVLATSASGDVRQVFDPAKTLSPLYMRGLDVCPLVIDNGNLASTWIVLETRRTQISLASGWNHRIYWDRSEKTFAQLPELLAVAANSQPRPYIILSAIGGDSADFSAMEDIVIRSAFCLSPEATGNITEASKPNISSPPNSLPIPAASAAPTKDPTQPVPGASRSGVVDKYMAPVSPLRVNSGYFDPNYPPSESRQHLGTDLAAPVGARALAPVSGRVAINRTNDPSVMQAFLVIHGNDGTEHVLGHIASDLRIGAVVEMGQVVGVVRAWPGCPTCSHVHWGINRNGISQAMWGSWGWGRAPLAATRQQAAARGWVDPILILK